MDEKSNSMFDKFVLLMDQNIRGVQIGIYTVAITGLAIAIRNVRPFTKFKKPSDIPKHFITSKIQLKGTVDRIDPNGALLMIQHKPLVSLFHSKTDGLPVRIAGVDVNSFGINWLQSIVAGNKVVFVPYLIEKNCVHCKVLLPQVLKNNKLQDVNIGCALVNIGFGAIVPMENVLASNSSYLNYYKLLKNSETLALRKKAGLWYYVTPMKNALRYVGALVYMSMKQRFAKQKVVKNVLAT